MLDMTRTLLVESVLPRAFWEEAGQHAVYIRNRSFTSARPSGETPHERVFGAKPDVSHVRAFGARVV